LDSRKNAKGTLRFIPVPGYSDEFLAETGDSASRKSTVEGLSEILAMSVNASNILMGLSLPELLKEQYDIW
jgi:hypothetical protein